MRKLIREPLIHFVLIGAALFASYAALNREPEAQPDQIVVSAGQVAHLTESFSKAWQRPPSPEELKGLIDSYVKEEVFSREAMKLGLDRDDTVIRRRLQQKMQFIADDLAALTEPTDEQLAAYLNAHPHKFTSDARFSLKQVYLNPEKRGDALDADAQTLLAELRRTGRDADISRLGDRLLLPADLTDTPRHDIAAQFGEPFASDIFDLPVDSWSGPVRSGYGLHLVLITARTAGQVPQLADVRDAVKREFQNEKRIEANRAFLDALMSKYQVMIESSPSDAVAFTGRQ
jgi:hypothetical protein